MAIMPFASRLDAGPSPGEGSPRHTLGDGLTEDIIMQLAKLRGLFVIGRGTVFALAERGLGAEEAGRLLDVDYVVSGRISQDSGGSLSVRVELADARDGRIVWTDSLPAPAGETFAVLERVVERIVSSIAEEIQLAESRRAVLKAPESLDGWEAYHRGLWHMYRFNGPDNRHAQHFFRRSLELDPTFSRAHAGLSFTHFQNAFLRLSGDRQAEIDLAFQAASDSLAADDHDPAAHWAMGRALWLRGERDEALAELTHSTELSPNFALGHYTVGFVQSQSGDPRAAISAIDHSRQLSPFDPLQFGMLASRAVAHVRLDEPEEAVRWAVRATSRPHAHEHILSIAAHCLALAGRTDEARQYVGRIQQRAPGYGVEDFLRSFRFDKDTEQRLRQASRRLGLG